MVSREVSSVTFSLQPPDSEGMTGIARLRGLGDPQAPRCGTNSKPSALLDEAFDEVVRTGSRLRRHSSRLTWAKHDRRRSRTRPPTHRGGLSTRSVCHQERLTILRAVDYSLATLESPAQLNARFEDADGHVMLDIVRSELMVRSDNWDVEIVGPVLTIWDDRRRVVMQLDSRPRHSLRFEKLRLCHRGFWVIIDQHGIGFGIMDDPPRCMQGGLFFGGAGGDRCALDFTADVLIIMGETKVPYLW